MTKIASRLIAVGQTYHDFKVVKSTEIEELNCQLIELIHVPTGAKVMHIANEDPENLFCISFQTLPSSSNGVAHVLEHFVLCGSKKFPIKDPFFAMLRRSLNTFMNAMTFSDFTCYPAASQVPQDFYNLLDVYLDAVFHPILDERNFFQEGHRLELTNPSDLHSKLVFKGVVFNEMKGAMSDSNRRLHDALYHALFPNITYGINSGGDPQEILSLTYEQLCEFHKTFYHPSRSLFFFYGNLPLEKHLDFISERIFKDANPIPPLPPVPLQPRFTAPQKLVRSYPISAEEEITDKTLMAFGWLTCSILEQQDLLAMDILSIILMATDACPLKLALLKSGLCKQASCYMDDKISEIPFVISLKGCNSENADQLEKIIFTTLSQVIRDGISSQEIDNAMHQLEIARSEITRDYGPFGLNLFLRSALIKQHTGDSEDGLKIHTLFEAIRHRIQAEPNYLVGCLQKFLIDNPHFVRITLVPDKNLAAEERAKEEAALALIEKKLTEKDRQAIVDKSVALTAFQEKQKSQNYDVLPKIALRDVSHEIRMFPLVREKVGNLEIFHHNCFTNKIVYADLIFDLPELDESDLPYVRLFTTLLTQLGAGGRDYAGNLEYILSNTGGVSASLGLNIQASESKKFHPSLYISGKSLHRKSANLLTLLKDFATSVDFTDSSRIKEVIQKQYTEMQNMFIPMAINYAINLSSKGLNVPSKISNMWYGLEYYTLIEKLAQDFEGNRDWLINKLQELQGKLLCINIPQLVVTSDAEIFKTMKGEQLYGLQNVKTSPSRLMKNDYPLVTGHSLARAIASPVAFTSKALSTVPYTHPDASTLVVASYIFNNVFLHNSLREKGGAYGGGASSDPMTGNFFFYAYRDPNIVATLDAFRKAYQGVVRGDFDASDIEEAKLKVIQSIDAPVSPGSRGNLSYRWMREGKSPEVRKAFKGRILAIGREEIIAAVNKHISPQFEQATTVVFADKELLEKENAKLVAENRKPLVLE